MNKICAVCHLFKDEQDYSSSQWIKNSSICRGCISIYNKQYRSKNVDKIKKLKSIYEENHKEKIDQYYKTYNDTHKEKRKQYYNSAKNEVKEYQKKNRSSIIKKRNERERRKRKTDLSFVLRKDISSRILSVIKSHGGSKNRKSIIDYLSYSIQELKEHLEKQFEPWMTWKNHGKYNAKVWGDNDQATWTWQIDHIIPQSKLPYSSMQDDNFKKCWALSNLRPLSAKQNIIDGTNRSRH